MALTVSLTPGKTFANQETVTTAKLNLLGQPSFVITGTVAPGDFTAGSVTAAATTPGAYWYADPATLAGNTYSATWAPAMVNPLVNGLKLSFKAASDYTDAAATGICLLNPNTFGAVAIKKNGKANLNKLDIRAGQVVDVEYDGTFFQMQSEIGTPDVDSATNGIFVNGISADLRATGTNSYAIGPVVGGDNRFKSFAELGGRHLVVQFANANTGSSTLNVNALGAKSITKCGGLGLLPGDIRANSIWVLSYDGTNFELAGSVPEMTYYGRYGAVNFAGTNVYTVSYATSTGPNALYQGLTISFRAAATSVAGGGTLNPNALGATSLTLAGGVAIGAGDIVANQIVTAVYNQADNRFEIISPSASVFLIPQTAFPVAGSMQTWNHGLARTPSRLSMQMIATVAELGYSIGDTISFGSFDAGGSGAPAVGCNATQIYYTCSGTAFRITNKNSATVSAFTPGSWRLTGRADL